MAGFNNREQFLASEPEMDMAQFRHVELDLRYADQSKTRFWLSYIWMREMSHIHSLRVSRRRICHGA